jgi:hypothetical protein
MKIVVLSESPVDEAAIEILIEGLVAAPLQPIGVPWLKTRGWPSLLDVLPKVVQYVHYQTDARGLVVVADSDHSPLHRSSSDPAMVCQDKCRMCHLHQAAAQAKDRLAPVPGRPDLGIAVGIAVPSIEAWYRCGLDHQVGEVVWGRALESGEFPYDRRRLKQVVYGTRQPTIALGLRIAVEQSRRVVDHGELERLEQLFPIGFGSLAAEVRSWRS